MVISPGRHSELLDIGIRFTEDVVTAATFIEPFPTFIRPSVPFSSNTISSHIYESTVS